MVSGYLVADAMGIMDTFWAIILPGVFSTFPVFIMAKGFDAVPIALLEAASIDGDVYKRQGFLYVGARPPDTAE